MKYERLTSGNFDGQCDHWTSLAFMGGTIGCWNEAEERYMLCEECIHKQRYDRLRELEDKIENGTLVELPYKVGDTVWFINEFVLFMGCPNIAIMCGRISKVIANISNEITYMYDVNVESALHATGYETHTMASGAIFLTKAEAEKRLEELRGKYDRNNQ